MYVYEQRVVKTRCENLRNAFPGFQIYYAVKANSNPAIVEIVKKEGLGIETVSPGEIRLGKSVGFPKANISFTCSNQTQNDLAYASRNAGRVHIDSLVQLETWGKMKLGKDVSLRINEGVGAGHHRHVVTGGPDSKFGISEKDVPEARKIAKKYDLRITGLEQHIGSNVLNDNTDIFMRSVRKLINTAREFPLVTHLDFGGGFGVPYKPGDRALNLRKLGKEVVHITKKFEKERGVPMTFALEPGRYVVAEAGVLLVSVVDIKSTSKHSFVGVNSGFNHLIRPAMYGSYHAIQNLNRKGNLKSVTIGGNVCESGDIFATQRRISAPCLGDVLAIRNAGAYGMTMASLYNLRALPREVLQTGGSIKDISFDPRRYIR